jgi:hypothetical protein
MSQIAIPINEIERMAEIISKANFFGYANLEQAATLMLIAQSEGRHPASAAKEYHIIKGRPALKADAMLARFQQAGGSVQWVERTDAKVSAKFSHPQGGEVIICWTIEDGKRAGLTSNDNWRKYPRQMLSARVISEGVRATYPSVVSGLYTPEEVQDFSSTPTPAPKPAIARPNLPEAKPEIAPVIEIQAEVAEAPVEQKTEEQEASTEKRDALWELMETHQYTEADIMRFITDKGVKTSATRIADLTDKIVARLVEKFSLIVKFMEETK